MECFEKKYEDAANSVGYSSADGGYLLPTQTIGEILIDDEMIFSDKVGDPYPLLNGLVSEDGTAYVRKDPYGPVELELGYSWEKFRSSTRGSRRFTLLSAYKSEKIDEDHPSRFFQELVSTLNDELITTLVKGTTIYRGREIKGAKSFRHKDLTSPPKDKAISNRMSPRGVPLFYGALEKATCVSENRPSIGKRIALSNFEVMKDLTVIDLGHHLPVKSIFHEDYDYDRDEFLMPFLRRFVSSIAAPIGIADAETEYLATQMFVEFLRFHPDYRFDGLLFKSSQNPGGINVVLFKEEGISTEDPNDAEACLLFRGYETLIVTDLSADFELVRSP